MTTTRQQILRSSTPGQVPAAGTRAPGELWTTFPDLQLGVVDASKTAQKLIAVRFFSTTANYAAGDFVVQAGALYAAKAAITAGAFNATQWTRVGAATDAGGPYLSIAGGTLTGPLVLAADPGAALGAATKQYVDSKTAAAPFLPLAGGTMLAPITLSGPPTTPLHAATKAYVDSGAFVPIAGGTMTGPLTLAANPAAPLQAATRQYVDALPAAMNDNRIINGDMRIDQRNNGASGTANGYTIDRWQAGFSIGAGTVSWGRNLASISQQSSFPYSLGCQTGGTPHNMAAGEFLIFAQPIEADMISDFQWGAASAQLVTLSFWAWTNTSGGLFGGSLRNGANTRSYPFTYTLSASTWQKFIITIPGDTAGTWTLSGNGAGAILCFSLGAGTNYSGPAGAWASANYVTASGAGNCIAIAFGGLWITGVKLETGSVATPYNRQSLTKSLADCQRYYYDPSNGGSVPMFTWGGYTSTSMNVSTIPFPVTMRAAPTMTVHNQTGGITVGSLAANTSAFNFVVSAPAIGFGAVNFNITASAEL